VLGSCFQRPTFPHHWFPFEAATKHQDQRSDGQSVMFSGYPIWDSSDFDYCQAVAGLLILGALCDERTSCMQQLLLGLHRSHIQVLVPPHGIHDCILLSQIRDSPTWSFRSLYLYPPRLWVPFSSPISTCRVTAEAFDPRLPGVVCGHKKPMLRPTVSWPFYLRVRHLYGIHDQIFITVRLLLVC
jgi:hypothetical protein